MIENTTIEFLHTEDSIKLEFRTAFENLYVLWDKG